jgi:hypothetical protein
MQEMQTKRKHTGGRPQLTNDERRQIRVQPSFTISEFHELLAKSNAAGLEVSEWLRAAGLGRLIKSVPAINRNAYSELAKLATNINQIAHVANATNALNTSDLVKTLEETHEKVQQLRAELIAGAH